MLSRDPAAIDAEDYSESWEKSSSSGGFSLASIRDQVATGSGNTSMALVGVGLLSVGVLFKVGAVPFHSWIPDVYQGAPTPVTAFMAAATKIAAFGAMLRIFSVALPGFKDDWRPLMWGIAILTMVVGTVTAVSQNDVKRMLAYSSVAHAGFLMTGLVGVHQGIEIAGREITSLEAVLFYLVVYGFATIGACVVMAAVLLVRAQVWRRPVSQTLAQEPTVSVECSAMAMN